MNVSHHDLEKRVVRPDMICRCSSFGFDDCARHNPNPRSSRGPHGNCSYEIKGGIMNGP